MSSKGESKDENLLSRSFAHFGRANGSDVRCRAFVAGPGEKWSGQLEIDTAYDLFVLAQENTLQTRYALNDLVIAVRDPGNEILGATLTTLSDALRAQLNVPAGQGILVESLRGDGPSAQAGLKRYDVLLTLADKPLATAEDLTKQLKAAGEAPVTLTLLRAGTQIAIQVRPVYRVTLGRVGETRKEYFIGIALGGLDDVFGSSAFLALADQGVIITNVTKNSPAEEAGNRAIDIVLEFGGKSVDAPDKLSAQVQAGQGKPTTIKLLRAGKPLNIAITAAMRDVDQPVESIAQDLALRLLNIADARRTEREFFINGSGQTQHGSQILAEDRRIATTNPLSPTGRRPTQRVAQGEPIPETIMRGRKMCGERTLQSSSPRGCRSPRQAGSRRDEQRLSQRPRHARPVDCCHSVRAGPRQEGRAVGPRPRSRLEPRRRRRAFLQRSSLPTADSQAQAMAHELFASPAFTGTRGA